MEKQWESRRSVACWPAKSSAACDSLYGKTIVSLQLNAATDTHALSGSRETPAVFCFLKWWKWHCADLFEISVGNFSANYFVSRFDWRFNLHAELLSTYFLTVPAKVPFRRTLSNNHSIMSVVGCFSGWLTVLLITYVARTSSSPSCRLTVSGSGQDSTIQRMSTATGSLAKRCRREVSSNLSEESGSSHNSSPADRGLRTSNMFPHLQHYPRSA